MEQILKRQQRTVGGILQIELEDGYHTYARILSSNIAFYDCRTKENMAIDEIVLKPVLFVLCVYDSVITKGYWKKIGKKLPIEPHLLELDEAPVYTHNTASNKFLIHYRNSTKEVMMEEVIGLESLSVWTNNSVEQRLNDHYANRFNQKVYDNLHGRAVIGMIEQALQLKER